MQAAKPNPTQATPIHKVITNKPIIRVPGCPPIPEVMTGVLTYMLTFDRLPDVDAQGRPKMFYSQRVHDKCYRRPHFDAGQFAEHFDDAGARMGYCLYKVGCKGPVTYNACSATRWNEGVSFPIQSGHGCIGCSEDAFWDKGSFYDHLTTIRPPGISGIEGTADQIGLGVAAVAGVGGRGARGGQRDQAGAQQVAQRQGERGGGIAMAVIQTQGFTLDNSGKRIVVDPITRIEGHLRIEVNVDKDNVIRNAVSTGTMWRGLEVILKGRDPRDAWAFTERICGVCTGVHALASVRAVEDAIGIKIPKNANIIRNLMHATLYAQDHLVHFYHLHALDWVDVVSALKADPEAHVGDPAEHLEPSELVAGVLPRRAEPAEEVRRERTARHLRQRVLGQPGVQAAAGSEPAGDDALSRGARLPEGHRQDPDDLRRQEPASELAGRRRAEPAQRRRHGRRGREQHGAAQHGRRHLQSHRGVHRPGLHSGPRSRSPASTRTGRSGAAGCRART